MKVISNSNIIENLENFKKTIGFFFFIDILVSFVLVRMVVRSTHHQTAWELLGTVDSKLVRRVERKIPLILSDGICRQNMWKVCIIAAFQRNHFQRFISMYYMYYFLFFLCFHK